MYKIFPAKGSINLTVQHTYGVERIMKVGGIVVQHTKRETRRAVHKSSAKAASSGSAPINCVLMGLILSYGITTAGILLSAVLLNSGGLSGSPKQYVLLVMVIVVISVLAGSLLTAKKSASGGFKWALVMGVLYLAIRMLVSFGVNGTNLFVGNLVTEIVSTLGTAALGGILGGRRK